MEKRKNINTYLTVILVVFIIVAVLICFRLQRQFEENLKSMNQRQNMPPIVIQAEMCFLINQKPSSKESGYEVLENSNSLNSNNSLVSPDIAIVPVFQHVDKILEWLKDYFQEPQHDALRKILSGKSIDEKLIFIGFANQMGDAFKQLFMLRLITGYTIGEEMIPWICTNFLYKNPLNEPLPFDKEYLRDIISGTKLCKNPIIDIKIDENNQYIFRVPDHISRRKVS